MYSFLPIIFDDYITEAYVWHVASSGSRTKLSSSLYGLFPAKSKSHLQLTCFTFTRKMLYFPSWQNCKHLLVKMFISNISKYKRVKNISLILELPFVPFISSSWYLKQQKIRKQLLWLIDLTVLDILCHCQRMGKWKVIIIREKK